MATKAETKGARLVMASRRIFADPRGRQYQRGDEIDAQQWANMSALKRRSLLASGVVEWQPEDK